MKQTWKRMTAALMAVVMTLALAMTAFAESTPVTQGNLTVKGDQLAGKYVFAIRMFTSRAYDNGNDGTPDYAYDSYVLEEKWVDFFESTENITKADWVAAGVIKAEQDDISDYSAAALKYLEWLAKEENADKVPAFAEKAQDWAVKSQKVIVYQYTDDENSNKVTGVTIANGWESLVTSATGVAGGEGEKDSAQFTNLTAGYYLVFPEAGGTGTGTRATDAMLINIPNEQHATWEMKSTYPTVDKKVDGADNGSAQIGDTVTFTLTSTVPDMSDYNTYKFNFVDTMSNGLTFVKAGDSVATTDVTVTIGGAPVTTGFTVTLEGQKLTVAFADLKTVSGADAGDAIVVTYRAMINENAVSTDPVTNEAKVEYSNDPNGNGMGESTPDKTDVYTYDIVVEKYHVVEGGLDVGVDDSYEGNHGMEVDSLTLGENEHLLAGAKFVLSNSKTLTDGESDASVIKLIATENGYRVAKPNEDGAVTSFVTNDKTTITISGLEAGTYYLHEIEAPAGYNKLTAPIEIKIEVLDEDYENPSYTIDGEQNSPGDNSVKVENKKGITLPETGSIGTIGLTVAGVAIVLLGVFATRKKKTTQE